MSSFNVQPAVPDTEQFTKTNFSNIKQAQLAIMIEHNRKKICDSISPHNVVHLILVKLQNNFPLKEKVLNNLSHINLTKIEKGKKT